MSKLVTEFEAQVKAKEHSLKDYIDFKDSTVTADDANFGKAITALEAYFKNAPHVLPQAMITGITGGLNGKKSAIIGKQDSIADELKSLAINAAVPYFVLGGTLGTNVLKADKDAAVLFFTYKSDGKDEKTKVFEVTRVNGAEYTFNDVTPKKPKTKTKAKMSKATVAIIVVGIVLLLALVAVGIYFYV